MTEIPDFLKSAKTDMSSMASDNDIANARKLCVEYIELKNSIEKAETELSELKSLKIRMEMRDIPDMFADIGVDKLGVPEANVDVAIKPYYKAGIASDWEAEKKHEAFSWLEDNGHGSVIRTVLSVEFGKSELEIAKKLKEFIEQGFSDIKEHPVSIDMNVHWATLTSLVKELAQKEEETPEGDLIPIEDRIPLELLGATVGRIATIKERK